MNLCGHRYQGRELEEYFGDSSVVAGFRRYTLREGRASGCDITEVRSGGGLALEVNESRGMDLGRLSLWGIPISYAACGGEAAPSYFEASGDAWLRTFGGGLLVTGGLTSMGAPEEDRGEALPLHGRVSHIPAERVNLDEEVDERGRRVFVVSGRVRECKALSHNLVLRRAVRVPEGSRSVRIDDEVENAGFEDQELMLLYHFNIGHPIVDEGARLLAPSRSVAPRDAEAASRSEPHDEYLAPTPGYGDTVYHHDLDDVDGTVRVALVNEGIGLGIALTYRKDELGCFTQWKFLGQGNYVAGIEPGTAFVGGRSVEREAGRVEVLPPGAVKRVRIDIELLDSAADIERMKRMNSGRGQCMSRVKGAGHEEV